jgi:translation initiation factor 3 subunit E
VLSTDTDLNTSAHWGKLASDILTGKWDVALEELNTLRETLDARAGAAPLAGTAAHAHAEPLATLHSRAWLVHWSLFVYFNHPAGRTLLLETFLAPAYLNTIQSAAPWVLRYLAVSAVLSRRTQAGGAGTAATPVSSRVRHAIREVVKVVQLEEYQYADPVTKFLKELYVEFDFEAAQHQLQLAERVVGNDFFLSEFREEFLDNARYLISEAYCRIHQRIDIAYVISPSLFVRVRVDELEDFFLYPVTSLPGLTSPPTKAKSGLSTSSATRGWPPMLRSISKRCVLSFAFPQTPSPTPPLQNVIEIQRPALPIYQSVIEKTRGLSIRTQALGAALSRTGQQQQTQPVQEQPVVVEGAR